jgi:hypothetical protein
MQGAAVTPPVRFLRVNLTGLSCQVTDLAAHTASVLRHLFTLGTFTAYTHETEPRDTVSVFTEHSMNLHELKPN